MDSLYMRALQRVARVTSVSWARCIRSTTTWQSLILQKSASCLAPGVTRGLRVRLGRDRKGVQVFGG